MPIGPELGRAGVRLHRAQRALGGSERLAAAVKNPIAPQLQIDHIAFGQIDDLIGHAGQRHGVAGEVVRLLRLRGAALSLTTAHPQHQRRAGARAHHTLRLGGVQHRNRVGAVQPRQRRAHGGQQVALVERIDQMHDHLGVGLAGKGVALGLQLGAQFFVVFDDAVVHQRDPGWALRGGIQRAGAVAEVRVRVVLGRRAVGGPARVGDAGASAQAIGLHLGAQFGHTRGAAAALQAARRVQRHAARVVAAVLQPL